MSRTAEGVRARSAWPARRERRGYMEWLSQSACGAQIWESMSVQITQIDLARPLVPVTIAKRHAALWALVKFGPQPLGWIKCGRRAVGSVLTPDALGRLIADALPLQVLDA